MVEDDLRSLRRDAYDRALSQIERLPAVTSGQVTVAQFGAVRHPGISDLDLLISGPGQQLVRAQREIEQLVLEDEEVRYVLWHPPLYVPLEIADCANALHSLRGMEVSAGRMEPSVSTGGGTSVLAARSVVPWAWFLFLLPIADRLLRRQRPSLRMILLVQKNLIETVNVLFGTDDWSRVDHLRSRVLRGEYVDPRAHLGEALRSARVAWNERVGAEFDLHPRRTAVIAGRRIFCSSSSPRVLLQGSRVSVLLSSMERSFVHRLTSAPVDGCAAGERFGCYRHFHRRASEVLGRLGLHNGFVTPLGLEL